MNNCFDFRPSTSAISACHVTVEVQHEICRQETPAIVLGFQQTASLDRMERSTAKVCPRRDSASHRAVSVGQASLGKRK